MPLKICCPQGHLFQLAENLAGKRVRCPTCKTILEVPALEQVAVADEVTTGEILPEDAPASDTELMAKSTVKKKKGKNLAKRKAERKWISPIAGATFTSGFGMRWGRMHNGNDFACPVGTPLMAMSQGTVIFAGQEGGYGNKVEIEYWDGTVSYYAHMDTISVTVGQQVAVADRVAQDVDEAGRRRRVEHVEVARPREAVRGVVARDDAVPRFRESRRPRARPRVRQRQSVPTFRRRGNRI